MNNEIDDNKLTNAKTNPNSFDDISHKNSDFTIQPCKLPPTYHSLQLDSCMNSKKQTEDEFQIISNEDINIGVNNNMRNSSLSEDNICLSPLKRVNNNLVKSSIITTDSSNSSNKSKNKSSVWSSLTSSISDLTNNLKYNMITTNSYVNFNKLNYIRLFDQIITDEEIRLNLSGFTRNIFQFTYRSDFSPIIHENVTYTSDCGWGCMIRASQMMLAKCILENKLFLCKDKENITEEVLIKLKYETLLLFFDNNLKVDEIVLNKDFKFINEIDVEQISQAIKVEIDVDVDVEKSNLNNNTTNNSFPKNNEDKILTHSEYLFKKQSQDEIFFNNKNNPLSYIKEVTPPFSIQNICKVAVNFDKRAGIWFSDVIMSSIFCEINKQFKTVDNLEMIHFNDGIVDEDLLLKLCFEELQCLTDCKYKWKYKCKENNKDTIDKLLDQLSLNESNPICDDCINTYYLLYPELIIKRENKFYLFKKGGVIFVSVRLGLDSISKEYYEPIRHIFKIIYNLGIIGGKRNSALHFIGESSDRLIYLDPHVNQKAIRDSKSLLIENEFHTYTPKYFYQINISNISPAFTTGFYFRSLEEYKNLLVHLNIHSQLSHPVFKFRYKKEELSLRNKKLSSKISKVIVLEEIKDEDDDYIIIDYDDCEENEDIGNNGDEN